MATPIIAAYDPLLEDRAPVELALVFGELTGTPVLAGAVDSGVVHSAALELLRGDTGVRSQSIVDASVPRALHDLARRQGSGLIVVGSTKRGRVGRVMPGSTAERVLHGAECAVALAPNGYRQRPIETVAVGFIDTPEGRAALGAAHELTRRARARLRAISVLHPSGELDAALANGTPPEKAHLLQGHHRAAHQEALDRAVAALPPGVEIDAELHVADAAETLIHISEHVDLLVCGSRGYGPIRSILLGGVSRRLVEGAHCPVLVLPRGIARPLADLLGPTMLTATR